MGMAAEMVRAAGDSNAAGRALRRPVVTRKNAGGSRNDDAAWLAARIWTVTATAEMAGLNPLTYLTAYLDAWGRNAGKPLAGPDLERFVPWNATPADLRARVTPSHRLTQETVTLAAASPLGTRHAGFLHARPQDFRIHTYRSTMSIMIMFIM